MTTDTFEELLDEIRNWYAPRKRRGKLVTLRDEAAEAGDVDTVLDVRLALNGNPEAVRRLADLLDDAKGEP